MECHTFPFKELHNTLFHQTAGEYPHLSRAAQLTLCNYQKISTARQSYRTEVIFQISNYQIGRQLLLLSFKDSRF